MGMCEALFWVWNLRSEDFFWVWNFVVTFFGWEILVRTFLGVDKKRNTGFSFLCQTIVSVSFTNYWRKVDAIIIIIIFLIGLFWGLRSGPLDFFWARVKHEGLFLGITISPHSHIPVTNIPEYPPWAYGAQDSAIQLMRSYLQDHKQRVKCNGLFSDWLTPRCGFSHKRACRARYFLTNILLGGLQSLKRGFQWLEI